MKAVVKQDFDYSSDGLTLRRLKVGEVHEISESLFPGLRDAGLVERAEEAPKPEPVKALEPEPPVEAPTMQVIPPAPRPAAPRTDNVPQQPKRFEDKRRRP